MAATRSLTPRQHDELLRIDRKNPDPELRSRAHILLLLAEGHPGATIEDVLFCSRLTIDRWLKRFEPQGAEGLAGRKRGCPFRFGLGWVAVLVVWVTKHTPRDFGFRRSCQVTRTSTRLSDTIFYEPAGRRLSSHAAPSGAEIRPPRRPFGAAGRGRSLQQLLELLKPVAP